MIGSFRHRGLRRLYETGDGRGIRADQIKRVRRILGILDTTPRVEDMNLLPGMRLHPLKGDLAGYWSVSVSGNWRIISRFDDGKAEGVDLVDHH
jgi:proteic killer suppression protein